MIESSILRIFHPNGKTVGTGFLVSRDLVITCAHVVVAADAIDGDTIQVQFTGTNEKITALVEPKYWRDLDKGDVAFLRLENVDDDFTPLRLGLAAHCQSSTTFYSYGYTTVAAVQGIIARGAIDGYLPQHKLLQLQAPQANHGTSGAPVLDEKRGVVVGMITKGHTELGRNEVTTFATPSELFFDICPEIRPSDTCPYLGLETFTDETAQFFFGRGVLTEKLISVLRTGCRFLALFGPSGSGKSSVVRAGFLPVLKKGQLPGSQKWAQITMRPGDNPFEQMKAAGLDPIDIDGYLKSHVDSERVVLFIDQFEEMFTFCPDDLRERFVRELVAALENSKLILVLSMRDDFYSAFSAKAALLAGSTDKTVVDVPVTLSRADLVAIIEQPAEAVGLALEEGLTELILKDITTDGEARCSVLPLLEFALFQLWEKRCDGRLTYEAYQAIGGVTGSLTRWADDVYSRLSKEDRILAEGLLTSLVHLGDETQGLPDTRRRRRLAEYDDATQRVIKPFADNRLLVTSGETVELVHDTIVREWGKLQNWIKDDRDNLRLREGVIYAAGQWEAGGRDESLLNHRGARLEFVLALSKLPRYQINSTEQGYLNACAELENKERNNRETLRKRIVTGLSIGLVIALALAGFAIYQMKQAQMQSKIALARQLAAQAVAIFGEDYGTIPTAQEYYGSGYYEQKSIALLLAVQSMNIFPSAEAAQILQKNNLLKPIAYLTHGAEVTTIAFSPNSKYIVSGSGHFYDPSDIVDNTARVMDIKTGQEISYFNHDGAVSFVAFSLDSNKVISASKQTIFIWDVLTGHEIMRMTQNDQIGKIAISNKYIVSTGVQTVHVWDVDTGHEITRFQNSTYVTSVDISPNNGLIAFGDGNDTIQLWDGKSESGSRFLQHGQDIVNYLEFSSDGKYLVAGSHDAVVQVLDTTTGNEISRVEYFNPVQAVALSPDGKYVISSSDDGITNVSDAFTGEIINSLTRTIHSSGAVAFSPDGEYFIAARADSHALFDIKTGQEIAYFPVNDFPAHTIENVVFSPDGRYIATEGCKPFDLTTNCLETSAIVWDASNHQELARLNFSDSDRGFYYFSQDGKYILPTQTLGSENYIYDVFANKKLFNLPIDLVDITISPNGKYIAATNIHSYSDFYVWDVNTQAEVADFSVNDALSVVSFSPDSRYIAAGGKDNKIHIWDISTKKEIVTLDHGAIIKSLSYSSNGQHMVSVGEDNIARVWDVSTGKEIMHKPHDNYTVKATLSPNGKYLLTEAFADGNITHVWNVLTGSEIFHNEYNSQDLGDNNEENYLIATAFSPDSQYIALGSSHGIINIFEIASGKEVSIMHQTREVETLAFSPDGKYLVSGGFGGTARVWDISLGQEIFSKSYDGSVFSVGFSPDGNYIFSLGCSDLDTEGHCQQTSAQLWKWRPRDLIDDSCLRLPRNLTRAEWQQYIGNTLPYQAVCPNLPIELEPTPTH